MKTDSEFIYTSAIIKVYILWEFKLPILKFSELLSNYTYFPEYIYINTDIFWELLTNYTYLSQFM